MYCWDSFFFFFFFFLVQRRRLRTPPRETRGGSTRPRPTAQPVAKQTVRPPHARAPRRWGTAGARPTGCDRGRGGGTTAGRTADDAAPPLRPTRLARPPATVASRRLAGWWLARRPLCSPAPQRVAARAAAAAAGRSVAARAQIQTGPSDGRGGEGGWPARPPCFPPRSYSPPLSLACPPPHSHIPVLSLPPLPPLPHHPRYSLAPLTPPAAPRSHSRTSKAVCWRSLPPPPTPTWVTTTRRRAR